MLEATNSPNLTAQTTLAAIAIASAAGSGFFTLIYKIIEKLLEAILAHRSLITTDKRQIADEIIKICTEGDRKAFQKKANDGQHIIYIANQLSVFNQDAEKNLREYQLLWELAAGTIQRKAPGDIEFYRELETKARIKSDNLLNLARKWKK